MTLSPELIEQFVSLTTPEKNTNIQNTVYATVVSVDAETHECLVQLDGADEDVATPVSYAANVAVGDRVLVLLKNRQATITGNLTSPTGEPPGYSTLVQTVGSHLANTDIHFTKHEILGLIYPVGSVYISFGIDIDGPEETIGFTWEEILSQDSSQEGNKPKWRMYVRTA